MSRSARTLRGRFVGVGVLDDPDCTEPISCFLFTNNPLLLLCFGCKLEMMGKADGKRTRTASQQPFWALFTLLSSPCASKASSAAAKTPPKLLAERCKAVFAEQIFVQAMKSPKRILCGFARDLKQHGRKSARKNRHGFVSRQPKPKNKGGHLHGKDRFDQVRHYRHH